jgi:hypothetical protein
VSRAADKATTSEWTSLSTLRARGWGKQRIIDTLKAGQLPVRWYPPGRQFDWQNRTLKIDYEENTASILGDAYPPETGALGFDTIAISEIEILVPVDDREVPTPAAADGAPLSPEDAQAALALPVDASNAPASTLEEDPEDHPDVPTLRQEMILAILDQKFPDGIPEPRRWAQLTESVRQGWKAECERRGVKYSSPDRKTVKSTVTRWRS